MYKIIVEVRRWPPEWDRSSVMFEKRQSHRLDRNYLRNIFKEYKTSIYLNGTNVYAYYKDGVYMLIAKRTIMGTPIFKYPALELIKEEHKEDIESYMRSLCIQ